MAVGAHLVCDRSVSAAVTFKNPVAGKLRPYPSQPSAVGAHLVCDRSALCKVDTASTPDITYSMPSIYETLRADIIVAMKARDSVTATILRTADAAIQRSAMDQNKPIDDALTTIALRKAVKNLSDAIIEFEKGARADLVAVNRTEIAVLEKYLPAGLDPAKLEALVIEVIAATGAASKKEMGKVIAALKQRPEAGIIDFGAASKLVQAKLP